MANYSLKTKVEKLFWLEYSIRDVNIFSFTHLLDVFMDQLVEVQEYLILFMYFYFYFINIIHD